MKTTPATSVLAELTEPRSTQSDPVLAITNHLNEIAGIIWKEYKAAGAKLQKGKLSENYRKNREKRSWVEGAYSLTDAFGAFGMKDTAAMLVLFCYANRRETWIENHGKKWGIPEDLHARLTEGHPIYQLEPLVQCAEKAQYVARKYIIHGPTAICPMDIEDPTYLKREIAAYKMVPTLLKIASEYKTADSATNWHWEKKAANIAKDLEERVAGLGS